SVLPESDFKRAASDFLNGEANLNTLLFELEELLPSAKKRRKKRGRKSNGKHGPRTSTPDPDPIRASEYARTQDLSHKNRRRLWELIKNGNISSMTAGKEPIFFEFFAGLFTRESQCLLDVCHAPPRRRISLVQYVSQDDISRFINK